MKVWVVEQGTYSEREIVGVYRTLDKMLAAHPSDKWRKADDGYWENGLEWDDACIASCWEVKG